MKEDTDLGQIDEALAKTSRDIRAVVDNLAELLIRKNAAYGDSALNPQRIFSSAPADEQIKVRLDDKLNRIRNATLRGQTSDAFGEDVIKDLMGYLVLLRVHHERQPMAMNCAAPAPKEISDRDRMDAILKAVAQFNETLHAVVS
jgi:hypothetical protein